MAILAPSAAKFFATPRLMPLPPPVTKTVLPLYKSFAKYWVQSIVRPRKVLNQVCYRFGVRRARGYEAALQGGVRTPDRVFEKELFHFGIDFVDGRVIGTRHRDDDLKAAFPRLSCLDFD